MITYWGETQTNFNTKFVSSNKTYLNFVINKIYFFKINKHKYVYDRYLG